MRLPVIRGIIDRRILANYRIHPDVMARNLPEPFRPKIVNGYAIGGICLIRLKRVRPWFFPFPWGIQSENAAHRIAMEWDDNGQVQEGVYSPRRDTDSKITAWAGGRIFPGLQHHATFTCNEVDDFYSIKMQSKDAHTKVAVAGTVTKQLPEGSIFSSVADVSTFFKKGTLGYSATSIEGRYDGIELCCQNWNVEPLAIKRIESSYFDDKSCFPQGSIEFDSALLMRNIHHEWRGRQDLCCPQMMKE